MLAKLGRDMLLVRRFEEFVLDLFSRGELNGTTHACIGQEAVVAGVFAHLSLADSVFSNHRCHGHYLLHQRDPLGLLAELMGREAGTCGGIGGSQHLQRGNFYTNGVQGGTVPALVGMTWARRFQGEKEAIGVVFLGDGTLGQGQVYESFNLASLWNVPVLFVIEHNGWSQSTPSHLQIAGEVAARPRAFGLPAYEVSSNWVMDVHDEAEKAVDWVRRERRPAVLICHTFRLCSHSRSDDARLQEVIDPWLDRDPILLLSQQIDTVMLEEEVRAEIAAAYTSAQASPVPQTWGLQPLPMPLAGPPSEAEGRVVQVLNQAFHRLLHERPNAVMVGMDILDPYGGAFKVEKGLSTKFPLQVLPTPVSETSLTGFCGGMALVGLRPILQIMFGDFTTLAVEPLVNYISKYRGMYNDQVRCPVVVRTAMGGGRGYGPTHSQSLEKLLLGIPDLRIVALSALHDPQALLFAAVDDLSPVLFIENKQLYTRPFRPSVEPFSVRRDGDAYPTLTFSPNDFRFTDGVIAVYGGQAEMALEAAETLIEEHDLAFEVVVFSLVYPVPAASLESALARGRGRLITLEEGCLGGGWGAEVLATCAQHGWLRKATRVGAKETVIPSARTLEDLVLPQKADLIRAALQG